MLDYFIFCAVLGTIPLSLYAPFVGILAWTWLAFMNPHRLGWTFVEDVPVAMIVGAATILAWAISREPKLPPKDSLTAYLLFLMFWITLTTLFAVAPDSAWPIWDRAIKILLMTTLAFTLVTNIHRLNALIWMTVLSIGFFGIKGGLFTILAGGQYKVWGPPESFIADNNALAMAILMTLPLMWYLAAITKHRWLRTALFTAVILSIFAVIGSFSRGAFLALVCVALYLALVSRRRVLYLTFSVVLGAILTTFVADHWVARMDTIAGFEEDESAQGRFDAWLFAFRLALDSPILAGGFRAYADDALFLELVPDAPTARSWHSVYFQVLGEHGFVGLVLFVTIFIAGWRRATGLCSLGKRYEIRWAEELGRMGQASFVAFAAAGVFLNMAFFDLYYTVLVIVAAGYRIASHAAPEATALETGRARPRRWFRRAAHVTRKPEAPWT